MSNFSLYSVIFVSFCDVNAKISVTTELSLLAKAGCTLDDFQILTDFKTMGDYRHEDSSTDF